MGEYRKQQKSRPHRESITSETSEIGNTAELEKHMNSKLFQKFLRHEGINLKKPPVVQPPKKEEEMPDKWSSPEDQQPSPKWSQNNSIVSQREISPIKSNEKTPESLDFQSEESPQYNDVELKGFSEHLQPGQSYAYYDDLDEFDEEYKENEDIQNIPNEAPNIQPTSIPQIPIGMHQMGIPPYMGYYPMYMPPDPMMMRSPEPPKAKQDLEAIKQEYESTIQEKEEEVRKLNRQLQNAKYDYMELEDKLRNSEDLERRFSNLRYENENLERKVRSLEDENEYLRKQLDHSKDDLESIRSLADDSERKAKDKIDDLEREVKKAREKAEDLERQVLREKDKQMDLERKLLKSQDKNYSLKDEVERSEEKIHRLERELEDSKEQLNYQHRQQHRETDSLRKQISTLYSEMERLDQERNFRSSSRKAYYEEEQCFDRSYRKRNYPREERSFSRREDSRGSSPPRGNKFEKLDLRKDSDDFWLREETPPKTERTYQKEELPAVQPTTPDSRSLRENSYQDPSSKFRAKVAANNSTSVGSALAWEEAPEPPPRPNAPAKEYQDYSVKNLENTLLQLQIEKKKLEDEFAKLPEHAKKIAVRRRREEVETELSILTTNIANVKNKLRQKNALL